MRLTHRPVVTMRKVTCFQFAVISAWSKCVTFSVVQDQAEATDWVEWPHVSTTWLSDCIDCIINQRYAKVVFRQLIKRKGLQWNHVKHAALAIPPSGHNQDVVV